MTRHIVETLKSEIARLPWMDESTRAVALEKVGFVILGIQWDLA